MLVVLGSLLVILFIWLIQINWVLWVLSGKRIPSLFAVTLDRWWPSALSRGERPNQTS